MIHALPLPSRADRRSALRPRVALHRLRRLLALLAALCPALLFAACSQPGGLTILDPQDPGRDYVVELGRLQLGETREHVVRLRNDERRTLTIEQVSAGCSCTTVKLAAVHPDGTRVEAASLLSEKPLALPPGAVLETRLHVESRSVPAANAPKLVLVRILSDSKVDPAKTLELHVFVEVPFLVVPKSIELGQVALGAIAQGKVDIISAIGTGERIVDVLSKPEQTDVVLHHPEELGIPNWQLHVRVFPPLERGVQSRVVLLSTTGPGGKGEGRPLEVRVNSIGVENVIAEPLLFAIPAQLEADAAAGAVVVRSLVAGNRLRVTGTRLEGGFADAFAATASPVGPDAAGRSERWTIELRCLRPPPSREAFAGQVIVLLDDSTTPEVRIPYQRRAAP